MKNLTFQLNNSIFPRKMAFFLIKPTMEIIFEINLTIVSFFQLFSQMEYFQIGSGTV